jgi:hypothetical protein
MRLISVIFLSVLIFGCKKKQAPKPPQAASLVFPAKSSECTTGTELNSTTTEVEFEWRAAEFTDTYELRVTDVVANTTQTINTEALSAKLPLRKGNLYSWVVNSRNDNVMDIVSSEVWQFYNAGFEITYAPFPANIVSPEAGVILTRDINNEVALEWIGTDIDNDIVGYEIYLSTEKPPTTLLENTTSSTTSIKASVSADTVYYWKVITIDREGNQSDSGIFDFRTL